MPRFYALALFALAFAVRPASAQGFSLTPAPPGARTITVQGAGEAKAAADHALIRFQVATEGATLEEALRLHEAEVTRVQNLLRAAGVPDERVTLDRVSVGDDGDESGMGMDMDYSSPDDETTETVRVSRALSAEVDDLDAVDGLVGQLASRDGDDALTTQLRSVVVSFERRETAALRETALRDAVRDARRRADLAAEASGLRVGRVLSITEGGVTGTMLVSIPTGAAATRLPPMFSGMMGGTSGQYAESARVVVVFEAE